MNKRTRTGLTKSNVLEKNRYRCIMMLLIKTKEDDRKIKFSHLKYALLKNHKSDNKTLNRHMEDFFVCEDIKNLERLREQYNSKKITKKEFYKSAKLCKRSRINDLLDLGWLNEKIKFSSEQSLRNALSRLKKLDLIKSKQDKKGKGYSFYEVTETGLNAYLRWNIHYNVNDLIPDKTEYLWQLDVLVTDFYLHIVK